MGNPFERYGIPRKITEAAIQGIHTMLAAGTLYVEGNYEASFALLRELDRLQATSCIVALMHDRAARDLHHGVDPIASWAAFAQHLLTTQPDLPD